jgi:phosphohistidine phosphatase SixA
MTSTPPPFEIGSTISPARPRTAASFVGLWPTTSARPPSGSDEADPELVEQDSAALAAALRRVLESLPEGGRALVVGHSPTNEAAVLGLAGEIVEPISKGAGVLVVEQDVAVRVEKLG